MTGDGRGGPITPEGIEFYDAAWAERWIDCSRLGPSLRHRRRLLLRLVRPLEFRSILDVGCGNGANLEALLATHPAERVAGIDVSSTAALLARQRLPGGEFYAMDVTRAHLDRTFDLVICCDVLEHIEDDLAALRHMRAMTGRHLLVSTIQGFMRPSEREIGHVRNYTRAGLEARLQEGGFLPERTIEWGFPLYSPIHRSLLERAGTRISEGRFGPVRRALASLLYLLFFLNSSRRGDILVSLARPAP